MANRWIRGRIVFVRRVLSEMCAGRGPFTGATWAVVVNGILSETPPPPSIFADGIPPELDRIILKALEKDRERRYREVAEISSDLRVLARDLESGRLSDAARPIARNAETVSADASPPAGSSATILPALHDYLQRFGDFGGQPLNPQHYVWPVASVRDASTGEEVSTEHVASCFEKSLRRTALPSCCSSETTGPARRASCACGATRSLARR